MDLPTFVHEDDPEITSLTIGNQIFPFPLLGAKAPLNSAPAPGSLDQSHYHPLLPWTGSSRVASSSGVPSADGAPAGGDEGRSLCGKGSGEVIGVEILAAPVAAAADDGSSMEAALPDVRREPVLPEADATDELRSRCNLSPATNMRG